ncbi:uncharacterized protein LOC135169793 [Diachasmimorpha longicaudata]|uniref:uncharacterized protein LOC135169793 n=1 Tax=Diachasmimorpha longicaudata TaxID=58733 RepID=UPI0030B8E0B4
MWKLLHLGALEECDHVVGEFISTFFLTPKPNGTFRFIFNLKELNKFIYAPHFKLEDLKSAMNLVSVNDFMGSIDLKDAYFVVPIDEEDRKFLRLEFKGQLFQFTCLPFGLSTSPFVFTKIMKPVVSKLRLQGMRLMIYLDDFLFVSNSKDQCEENMRTCINLLENLGFIVNFEKSSLVATQKCKYLGFVINSVNYSLELPDKKKIQIKEMIKIFKKGGKHKIRQFATLLGVLTAACPAMEYGSIHCKRLERQKFLALKFNGGNYEGKILINDIMFEDLEWWQKNVNIGLNPIRRQEYSMVIFSDSSLTGWGCYCNNIKAHGFWSEKEQGKHINYLELLAAFFALRCFASKVSNTEILLRLDNTTAVSYINKSRGIQFPHLSELSRKIWEWCERRKLWIRASYIPSKENIEADSASRITNIDTEWSLSPSAFERIEEKFGPFSVDLFATRLNNKCNKFYSRFPDPQASIIDAFTVSWKEELFYAFPPFALILRSLRKIINDEATGILERDPSPVIPPFIGGREIIRSAYSRKGIDESSVEKMINSIAASTLRQYECQLKRWWSYAHAKQLDVFNAKTSEIIEFLNSRSEEGSKYNTLNSSRAAIALITSYDVNNDGLISRFMRGVFRENPTKARYSTTWNITPVLDYLEKLPPLQELTLSVAAEKLCTLLALTTAQRLQTLSLIRIDNIVRFDSYISIKITELVKTSKPGSSEPDLILPFFPERPGLCVASLVLDYIKMTQKFRNEQTKNLLIATMKPYGAISAQTIGHWIKRLLGKAGIDISQFGAYSTRHSAVSAAHKRGIDIATIRRTAGWAPESQTFFKFYNRPIQPLNDEFAHRDFPDWPSHCPCGA